MADLTPSFSLAGKTALVTGASRGLGLNMATALALAGCTHTILTARRQAPLDRAVDSLRRLPGIRGAVTGIAADASSSEGIQRLASDVSALLGSGARLDILVCNAGTAWGSRFEDAPPASSVKILDLNVRGVFELVQK